MQINPIVSYSFRSLPKSRQVSDVIEERPVDGYKTEFYNKDGSFKESVELKYNNDGIFIILNECL